MGLAHLPERFIVRGPQAIPRPNQATTKRRKHKPAALASLGQHDHRNGALCRRADIAHAPSTTNDRSPTSERTPQGTISKTDTLAPIPTIEKLGRAGHLRSSGTDCLTYIPYFNTSPAKGENDQSDATSFSTLLTGGTGASQQHLLGAWYALCSEGMARAEETHASKSWVLDVSAYDGLRFEQHSLWSRNIARRRMGGPFGGPSCPTPRLFLKKMSIRILYFPYDRKGPLFSLICIQTSISG